MHAISMLMQEGTIIGSKPCVLGLLLSVCIALTLPHLQSVSDVAAVIAVICAGMTWLCLEQAPHGYTRPCGEMSCFNCIVGVVQ